MEQRGVKAMSGGGGGMKGAKPTVWRKMKRSQHRREGAEGLAEAAGLDEKGNHKQES